MTFTSYDHLPEQIRSALSEFEQLIEEVDGQTLADPATDGCFVKDKVIDAKDMSHWFNVIVGALFTDEECYQLFIAMDNRARAYEGKLDEVNALRERLLPFYRDWHAAHPHEVHPSATRATAAAGGST